ncbi:hypothetical protein [Pseudomonas vancouverensis]|uniref:hypothetical protein n=1 Tax=Pseudomonas vancouverensis TaxID=95300 RepID=UPI001478C7D4|nr:hypothetical protein [Pseudomonas vancouverensis]
MVVAAELSISASAQTGGPAVKNGSGLYEKSVTKAKNRINHQLMRAAHPVNVQRRH